MLFLRVDQQTLRARIEGDAHAPPLVMIHALGTDLRLFDRLARYLVDRLRLIRYDQRGHGMSDLGAPPYTIDGLASDAAALMDQLDTGPAVLCGISLGGMVALRLAATRPELVRGLVLMDTAARIGTRELWQERIDAIAAGGLEAIADAVLGRWFPPSFHAAHPEEVAGWRAMLVRTPAAGYAGACAAIRDADLEAEAKAIRAPALCLVGEHDASTPPDVVQGLAAMLGHASFHIVQEAGHLPCVDQPAAVAAAMLGFLEAEGLA